MAAGGPIGGPSNLDPVSNALHVAHQVRDKEHVGDQYMETYNFAGPVLGDNNTFVFPSNTMVVRDVWIQFQMPAAAGAANPAYIATPNWLGNAGAQLLLNDKSLISVSEQEQMIYNQLVCSNATQLLRRLTATNNLSTANRRTANGAANMYYMNLRRIADLWQFAGPIGSYPSSKWALDIDLKAANKIVDGSDTAAGTVSAITSMKVILVGHRESDENMGRISARLAAGGVRIMLTEANIVNQTWAAAATTAVVSAPNLEGEMTSLIFMIRETAGITGATGSTVNPNDFNSYDLITDTLSIGTSANPTKLYGKAMPMKTLRWVAPNTSYPGGGLYYDAEGAIGDKKLIILPLAENEGADMRFGAYSGSRYIKNDLEANFAFASTVTADTCTMIVYLSRGLVLGLNGFSAFNWEAAAELDTAGVSMES